MGGEGETVNSSQLSGLKLEKKKERANFLHVIIDRFTGRLSKAIF